MGTSEFDFQARCRRVQANMIRAGVDYLLVGPSADLFYLIGLQRPQSERLTQLVIPADGDDIRLLLPAFERALAAPLASFFELVTWEETEDPVSRLASLIPNKGRGKCVAVSNKVFVHFAYLIHDKLSGASFVSGGTSIDPVRMRKEPGELELLVAASESTDRVFVELIKSGLVGLTEQEVKARIVELVPKHGQVTSGGGIVGTGANGASPHHHVSDTRLQAGDAVVIDFGGLYKGYCSDMTRTIHVGEPSPEFQRVYAIVLEANQRAFEAVRPGVVTESIDKVARDHITEAGYGEQFLHRTGHGIGLEVHENPYIVRGNDVVLEEGMTFSIEPGIYLEGNFGVRIEDLVVVKADGAQRLNKTPHSLPVL